MGNPWDPALRNARMKRIFARVKEIGMSEAERHRLVKEITGKESLKDCNVAQLNQVVDKLGPGGHPGNPKTHRPGAGDLLAKIEAQLADMKLSWGYAKAILKRVSGHAPTPGAGVDRLEWATPDQLTKVVAALAYEQQKRHALAALDEALAQAGKTRADAPYLLAQAGIGWRLGWERQPKTVRALLAHLHAQPPQETAP